jgi:fatty-acid desaturase
MDLLTSMFNALVQWLGHGFSGFSGWEIVAYTLITTHITIAAVTIFLHRAQAAPSTCTASRRISSVSGSGSAPAW